VNVSAVGVGQVALDEDGLGPYKRTIRRPAEWPDQLTLASAYFRRISELLEALQSEQAEAIEAAARLIAGAWAENGRLMIARTNHCLHDEVVYRAGGPVAVAVLDEQGEDLLPMGSNDFNDRHVHALPNLNANDVLVIHSNAGTTEKAVGIALLAREQGTRTVALTQLEYETSPVVRPWHPSGRRLHEVCDICIDLGGDVGDAALELPASSERVAPTSGVTGMVAMWALIARAAEVLEERGLSPLLLRSVQLPGSVEHNDRLIRAWEETGVGCQPIPGGPSGRESPVSREEER
jgi:uncharacterized phosphosugar-binding protein